MKSPTFRVLALSLATACQLGLEPEPAQLSLKMERGADSPLFSWEGGKLHRFDVLECTEPPSELDNAGCGCSGHLLLRLRPVNHAAGHEPP